MTQEKRKQLPIDKEAKRCVLIFIEEECGVILRVKKEGEFEYVYWTPYKRGTEYEHGRNVEREEIAGKLQKALSADGTTIGSTGITPRTALLENLLVELTS